MATTRTRVLVALGAVIAVVAVVAFLWEGFRLTCTAAGCTDSIGYLIPEEAYVAWGLEADLPIVVETCVDGDCRTFEARSRGNGGCCNVRGDFMGVGNDYELGRTYDVTLRVTDPQGMVRYARTDSGVTLEKFQPNGPRCSPTCYGWGLELTPADLGL